MPDGTERLATTTTVLTEAVRHQTRHAPDPTRGPATWLMRADGSAVTWPGAVQVDIWDLRACPCDCHADAPALGHGWWDHTDIGPAPEPAATPSRERIPERRVDQPPPGPPVPVIADAQLDLLALTGGGT